MNSQSCLAQLRTYSLQHCSEELCAFASKKKGSLDTTCTVGLDAVQRAPRLEPPSTQMNSPGCAGDGSVTARTFLQRHHAYCTAAQDGKQRCAASLFRAVVDRWGASPLEDAAPYRHAHFRLNLLTHSLEIISPHTSAVQTFPVGDDSHHTTLLKTNARATLHLSLVVFDAKKWSSKGLFASVTNVDIPPFLAGSELRQ